MSSEFTRRRPENERNALSPKELEREMVDKRTQLAEAYSLVQAKRIIWNEKTIDSAERTAAWQVWKDARKVYAKLLEDVAEYEHARGEQIMVPDGKYTVSMTFEDSQDRAMKTLQELMLNEYYANLKELIKASRVQISMRGIQNAGFYPEGGEFPVGDCEYKITGPEDFTYHSFCKVDRGGHIVLTATDLNQ